MGRGQDSGRKRERAAAKEAIQLEKMKAIRTSRGGGDGFPKPKVSKQMKNMLFLFLMVGAGALPILLSVWEAFTPSYYTLSVENGAELQDAFFWRVSISDIMQGSSRLQR